MWTKEKYILILEPCPRTKEAAKSDNYICTYKSKNTRNYDQSNRVKAGRIRKSRNHCDCPDCLQEYWE